MVRTGAGLRMTEHGLACHWDLMPDTADLTILHLFRWPLFRWLLVTIVLEIRVLGRHHVLLLLSLRASVFFYTIVEFIAGVVGDFVLLFLLGCLGCIDFRRQLRLKRRGLRLRFGLAKRG